MERWIGLVGIAVMVALGFLLSTNRRAIDWRTVWVAMGLQLAIAFFALETTVGSQILVVIARAAIAFIGAADAGIVFVFGDWLKVPTPVMGADGGVVTLPFVFAVRVLPIIIFVGSVFAVLYHLGIVQRVVQLMARILRFFMPISGAESLSTAANVFVGMTEAPLMIRPYVAGLTRSELFLVMTAGLATVAGDVLFAYVGILGGGDDAQGTRFAAHLVTASFMSAPAAVAFAKLLVPEEGRPATAGDVQIPRIERENVNVIDAAAAGATEGLRLALNVGAMLVAFVSLVYVVDAGLGLVGSLFDYDELSMGKLLGLALSPLAWLMGVPWADAPRVGELLGVKTVINEFVAYIELGAAQAELSPKSVVIASYALCGFANFGSLAILLGGLGGIAPARRPEIARDGMRAILAGSLATFCTGAIAGILM